MNPEIVFRGSKNSDTLKVAAFDKAHSADKPPILMAGHDVMAIRVFLRGPKAEPISAGVMLDTAVT